MEFDPTLAANARAAAPANVEVVTGDASTTDAFAENTPANIALFCGIFGNVADDDIKHTIEVLPSLLAPNGEVIWTRHRFEPDLTHAIRAWFAEAGFTEMAFTPDNVTFGVGTHRLTTTPAPFEAGVTMFTFVR